MTRGGVPGLPNLVTYQSCPLLIETAPGPMSPGAGPFHSTRLAVLKVTCADARDGTSATTVRTSALAMSREMVVLLARLALTMEIMALVTPFQVLVSQVQS